MSIFTVTEAVRDRPAPLNAVQDTTVQAAVRLHELASSPTLDRVRVALCARYRTEGQPQKRNCPKG
jgi:hypothetical protein